LRSRTALVALVAFALAALVDAGPTAAGLADRVGATFALMADEFIKTSQPVEGTVVSLDDTQIFLDLGEGSGVRPGQELTVFRKGEAFLHPLTGKPLGRYEEQLGYAQIRRVFPQFAEATFVPIPDRPAPQPGDGARVSRGRIKVAVTPLLDLAQAGADVRRVPYLIASALERSKRFVVVDPLSVADVFAGGALRVEEILARPDRAMRVARNLDVSGWIVPVLLERQGALYLDTTWISAITGTPLFSRREIVLPAGSAEEQRFPWEPRAED
jgi:Flagellar assembly protein T, C-terminal domain